MCLRATIEKINYENSFDFDAEGILAESDAVTIDESDKEPSAASSLGVPIEKRLSSISRETVGELERQLYIMG